MDATLKQLTNYYPAIQVAFLRGILPLPLMLTWVFWKNDLHSLKPVRFKWHIIRGFISIGFLVAVIYAFRELPLAEAYAIFFAAPIVITLLSIFWLKEKVGLHRWIAIFIGLIGVMVMLRPTGNQLLSFGTLMCIIGVIGYSISIVLMRIMSKTESDFSQIFFFLVFITLGCGILSVHSWVELDWGHWPLFLILAVAGSTGQYLLTLSFRLAPAAVIAPFEYTSMLWAVLFGYVFWQDIPDTRVYIGGFIVIMSGVYIFHREKNQQLSAAKLN